MPVPIFPGPPSFDAIAVVLFTFGPPVFEVTSTEMVQGGAFGARVPPANATDDAPATAVKVGPQLLVVTNGVATTIVPGNGSVNPTPVRVAPGSRFGLFRVKVRVVVLPFGIEVGRKAFEIMAGAITNRVAVDGVPFGPLLEVGVAVFVFKPRVVPVTFTVTVQLALAASDGMLRVKEVAPATGAKVPMQDIVGNGGAATTRPAGKLSVSPTLARIPVAASVFGLVIRNEAVDMPFKGMLIGLNVFRRVGARSTVRSATAGAPFPPSWEPTTLVTLCFSPTVVPVTVTLKEQLALGPSAAPASEMVVVVVVRVPPQAGTEPAVVVRPAGNVSVKLMPLKVAVMSMLLLVRLKVRVLVSPTLMPTGEKVLVNLGGPTIVMSAVAEPVTVLDVVTAALLVYFDSVIPITSTAKVQVVLVGRLG